jgi:hypothetical protein
MRTAHLVKRPRLTERKRAANRLNAQKSTGPRTERGKRRSSLNALKHGVFARSLEESMQGLGEDPAEFERLKRDFIVSFQPATPFEAALVDDLASLWWRKARAQRAEAGMQVAGAEQQRRKRREGLVELNRTELDIPPALLPGFGLMRLPDSRGKFLRAGQLLETLRILVERRRNLADVEALLRALYGKHPTWRGNSILSLVRDLRRAEPCAAHSQQGGTDAEQAPETETAGGRDSAPAGPPAAEPDLARLPQADEALDAAFEPAEDSLDEPTGNETFDEESPEDEPQDGGPAEAEEEDGPRPSPQALRALLVGELVAESDEIAQARKLFLECHGEYPQVVRFADLTPDDHRWPALMRYENDLESRIDRKLKQLEKLQSLGGWGGRLRRMNGYVPPQTSGGNFAGPSLCRIPLRHPRTAATVPVNHESRIPNPESRVPTPEPRLTKLGNAKTKPPSFSRQKPGARKGTQNEPPTKPERSGKKGQRSHPQQGGTAGNGEWKIENRNSKIEI